MRQYSVCNQYSIACILSWQTIVVILVTDRVDSIIRHNKRTGNISRSTCQPHIHMYTLNIHILHRFTFKLTMSAFLRSSLLVRPSSLLFKQQIRCNWQIFVEKARNPQSGKTEQMGDARKWFMGSGLRGNRKLLLYAALYCVVLYCFCFCVLILYSLTQLLTQLLFNSIHSIIKNNSRSCSFAGI